METIEIRKSIKKGGFKLYMSLPEELKNIAGEFMYLNEEYLLSVHRYDTVRSNTILARGFSNNQEILLQEALKHYKK